MDRESEEARDQTGRKDDTIEKFKINVFLFLFFKLFLKIESSESHFRSLDFYHVKYFSLLRRHEVAKQCHPVRWYITG